MAEHSHLCNLGQIWIETRFGMTSFDSISALHILLNSNKNVTGSHPMDVKRLHTPSSNTFFFCGTPQKCDQNQAKSITFKLMLDERQDTTTSD